MRRLPPLRALEAFVRVAKLGSAKAAAADLSLSAPALSRRIKALEEFVDKPLFERRNQSMSLNEDGKALLAEIAPALEMIAAAAERHSNKHGNYRLRLGVLPLFASQRLFPKLPELRKLYPRLHIDIDTSGHGENLLGDVIDAAIILADEVDPALHSVRLDRNTVYAIGAATLAEGPNPLVSADQLTGHTLLLHNEMPLTFEAWKQAVDMPDIEPAAIDHFDSGPLMLEAAAQGLGIAIMHGSHYTDARDPRLARFFEIEAESPYSYWFVCKPRALEIRAVRLFHDWLIKVSI